MKLRIPGGVKSPVRVPQRVFLVVTASYLGMATIVAGWLWQSWGGAYVTRVADDVGSLAGILFAVVCAGLAARSANRRLRRGWLAMMAGLLAWAAGEVVWGSYEIWRGYEQTPYPSWADAFYLLYPIGAGAAVLLLTAGNGSQSRVRLVLDGVIVAASFFLVSWVTVLDNVFRAGGDTRLALAVSLAYPVADVAIVTIAWARIVVAYRPSLGLLVSGLIIIALTDSAFAGLTAVDGYYTGHLIDLGWIVGCGVLGLAALRSIGEPPVEQAPVKTPSRVQLWLPYVPVLLAAGIGLSRILPGLDSIPLDGAVVTLVVAVLARQLLALVENQRLLRDVSQLAFRDQLTGLANRTLFLDRLERALARQRRDQEPLAVLCLDLDNFKTVNDELGHPAGDELLVRVAGRLSESLRSSDTVARLGGDEFAILIEGAVDDATVAARRILDTFASPIVIDGVSLTVRPSVGLTLAGAETTAATVDDLLRQADLAMYAAKRDGGGCLRSFVPDLPNPYDLPRLTVPPLQIGPATSATSATEFSDSVREPAPTADRSIGRPSPGRLRDAARWPPLGIRLALGALLAGVVIFAVSTLVRPSPGRIVLLDSWFESVLLLSAAVIVAIRAWIVASERWAWLLIAAGMTTTGLATVVYAVLVPEGQLPSVADALFLAFYPFVYAGLLLLLRARLRHVPAAIRLDAVVVALTSAAVGAALIAGPIDAATSGSLATVLVGMAYPIGGVVLASLAAGSLAILGWRTEWRWGLVVAAFALWVLADIVYLFQTARGSYVEGTWIDACWPAAFLLIAAASWLPSGVGVPRLRLGHASVMPPVVCTAIALGVAVIATGERLAVTLAALSLIAVAARFAATFRDVSALAEGHQQAMTDDLTGLANRRALATALTAAAVDEPPSTPGGRAGSRLALLLLDVDQFREISDSLGSVSDELLRRIAHRLSQAVRPDDLLARVGGDKFAVLMTGDVDVTKARAQAGALMDALRTPFALDHITVQVEASIAIALWPGVQPQELLNRAEAAMADAKTAVGGISVYTAAADIHNSIDTLLIEDLRTALNIGEGGRPDERDLTSPAGDGLICHYQPKIRADEQVHGVEALVRWQHPTRGLLLPDDFLPTAERAGLMPPLATRVLDIALGQIRWWHDHSIALTVAVNLSATNLLDLSLVETIDRLLQTHALPAETLTLEITESTLVTDSQRARSTVAALRELGVRISLDDYGTGWSSLARLQELSVDELKLDQVFVARLARDPRSIAIVRSTVALAHSLDAELVAEGVEDEATLRALRLYGCTITQGHVHSPPLPPDELREWLTNQSIGV